MEWKANNYVYVYVYVLYTIHRLQITLEQHNPQKLFYFFEGEINVMEHIFAQILY